MITENEVFAELSRLAQLGIDCMGLPEEDCRWIAEFGFHRWLKERASNQAVTKTAKGNQQPSGSRKPQSAGMMLEYHTTVHGASGAPESVPVKRKGGRPRKEHPLTHAERQRRYRAKRRTSGVPAA